jgi:membrane protein DedA with SNARE-associated domain
VITWLTEVPPWAAYLVATALVFAETSVIIGLVLPGEVTLLLVGFLCSLGTLDPVLAGGIMTVVALAGDSLAFSEGKRLGRRLEASRLGRAGPAPTPCWTGTAGGPSSSGGMWRSPAP